MKLRYFSMGKVTTRVWLLILLASFSATIMSAYFPYLVGNDSHYYYIEQQLQQYAAQLNQSSNQTQALGQALSGNQGLADRFKAYLTLTPIGFSIRMLLMMMEGIATGLHPIWLMLGLGDVKTSAGVSIADMLSGMVYLFYGWTIYNIATGRDE